MTKAKAERRLKSWRNHLNYWREAYVENERDTNTILDIRKWNGKTTREEQREEYISNINEAKMYIAKFERIAL